MRHRTPYGLAECGWQIADGRIEVEVVVPPNTTAAVSLPGSDAGPIEVASGSYRWSYPYRRPEPGPAPSLDSTLISSVRPPGVERGPGLPADLRPRVHGPGVGRAAENSGVTLRAAVARGRRTDEVCGLLETTFARLGL